MAVYLGENQVDLESGAASLSVVQSLSSTGGTVVEITGTDISTGAIQIGLSTPVNILNMFHALETGTAVQGSFILDSTIPDTNILLCSTGLNSVNGIAIFDSSYYHGIDTSTTARSFFQFVIIAKFLVPYQQMTTYDYGIFGAIESPSAAKNGYCVCNCSLLDGTENINYAYWTLTNGNLYVKGNYNKHAQYTPFKANTLYKWIAW